MEQKLVLLFGSFNPVTKSHVDTLVKSMEKVGGTKGMFIPTSHTELYSKMIKNKGRIALSNETRVKMLQSICDNDPRLSVCTYEIDNDITSNTKQTIEYIIKQYPNTSIYYTCGADKLKSFSKWNNIEDIFKNVEILVFNRSDISIDTIINDNEILLKYKHKFHILDKLNDSDISSTKVRKLFLSDDQSYKQLLPQSVSKIFETLNPLDYPELELSEWIKLMFKYGGMHGKEKSLKELYNNNKLIIKDKEIKQTIFNSNPKLNDVNTKTYNPQVTCVNTDLLTEYNKDKKSGYNPVIITVCNKERACGKYDMGDFKTITDEEELCRISTLSSYLYPYGKQTLKGVKECVTPFKEEKYPITHNDVIYCKDVIFFRNTKNNWYSSLKQTTKCNIILTPSISLREKGTPLLLKDLKYKQTDGFLNYEGKQILKTSIINTFITALNNNHDSLIITDFGIRSYYLKEEDVSEVFIDVLNEYKNKFRKIVFVLPYNKKNYYKKFYEEIIGE